MRSKAAVDLGREANSRILDAVQCLSRAYRCMGATPPSPTGAQAHLSRAIATLTAVSGDLQEELMPLCDAIREIDLGLEPSLLRNRLLHLNGRLLELSRAVALSRSSA